MTQRRLIEEAFPLRKVSEDSRHEKNVRHGHISTLHIWPARRPAAVITALMPDPGDEKSLHQNEIFWAMAQAVLETVVPQSRERTLLEALVAWGRGRVVDEQIQQEQLL